AGQPCVRFRVGLVFRNAGLLPIEFAIDNLRIENSPNPDVMVEAILSPTNASSSACTFRNAVPVSVRVRNLSCTPLTNVPIRLTVAGPIPATIDRQIASLGADAFVDYNLAGATIDMSAVGTYTLTASSSLSPDANPANNSASQSVDVTFPTLSTYPYEATFEGGTQNWVPSTNVGGNNWVWGVLPATYTVDGPEGRGNSWRLVIPAGTGSGGGPGEAPWLTSPVFDLSATTNPVLSFEIKGDINNSGGWNQVVVQVSTNGGQSWSVLGSQADPDWYGAWPGFNQGWSSRNLGALSNWRRVQQALCAFAGNGCVQLRFGMFFRNSGVLPVEFAVDNIRVDDTPLDAALTSISGCYGSSYPMQVTIFNRQRCTTAPVITTATVTVEINGSAQSFNLTGLNIPANTTRTVTLGETTIPTQTSTVRAWVKLPNGLNDQVQINDSIVANVLAFPNCNDHCSNAIALGLGTTTASQTTAATTGAEDPGFSGCSGFITVENTVWYTFSTTSTGGNVTLIFENIVSNPGNNGIQVEVMQVTGPNPCTAANRTTMFCSNPGTTSDITWGPNSLPANTQYVIAVDGFAGNDADFDITLVGDGVLPVEGLVLSGELQAQDGILSWRTDRELNNDRFELRRNSGTGWQTIATQQGGGTTSEPRSYQHVDAQLPKGLHYYQLKQFDFDGTGHYSNVVALAVGSSGLFTLGSPYYREGLKVPIFVDEAADVQLRLITPLGQEVFSTVLPARAGAQELDIPVRNLAKAVYILQATYKGQSQTQRFILLNE
ncbi:MAG: hypothetical protein LW884_04075, partial [Bacteroidetes bacterium]|nr:hypothetical protein [Bacteroidota bacterium]